MAAEALQRTVGAGVRGVKGICDKAGTMGAGTMEAGTMEAGTMEAGTMEAGTMEAGTVEGGGASLELPAPPAPL
ncbi:hypothetical protein CYMTET_29986 [Cymbomonas tetramitiformis]|uniref:Uncharacterized protein n=1 Tax=Cymbomonas tetramitiformis TaxID=36881 RepID=A0AAE0FLB6_9CHLO|nr:hypothetical protein CYMTET_29986 [Cymbomonas tetramitiformis]